MRSKIPLLLPALVLSVGCRPPEAPEDFTEMLNYGFEHFADEDPWPLQDLGDKLIPWIEANFEETSEGYEIAALDNEALAGAGLSVELESGIVGVSVGVDYSTSLDHLNDALTTTEQTEIFSTYVEFTREESTDRDCYLSRECEFHWVSDELHASVGLGIELWSSYDVGFRNIQLEDGSWVMVRRMTGEEPTELSVDFFAIHQQYGFSYMYERDDGRVRRVQAMWADGEVLDSDLGEGFHMNLTITSMQTGAEDVDAWMVEQGWGIE